MSELHTNQLIELAKGFLSDHPYGDCLLLNEKKRITASHQRRYYTSF